MARIGANEKGLSRGKLPDGCDADDAVVFVHAKDYTQRSDDENAFFFKSSFTDRVRRDPQESVDFAHSARD